MTITISNSLFCIPALFDSESTHCFVVFEFVRHYNLPALPIPPIDLRLFDGTSNSIITQSVSLPVIFLSGESITFDFYVNVTLLNLSCSLVLASVSNEAPDLLKIPTEYHDYAHVFSKAEASKLPPHHLYDLKITLEEGTSPPLISVMYSLFLSELKTSQEFIDDNLCNLFI